MLMVSIAAIFTLSNREDAFERSGARVNDHHVKLLLSSETA
jgi:hypothetical protein